MPLLKWSSMHWSKVGPSCSNKTCCTQYQYLKNTSDISITLEKYWFGNLTCSSYENGLFIDTLLCKIAIFMSIAMLNYQLWLGRVAVRKVSQKPLSSAVKHWEPPTSWKMAKIVHCYHAVRRCWLVYDVVSHCWILVSTIPQLIMNQLSIVP